MTQRGLGGLRVFAGVFENHDYLWFSSFEISKLAATYPVIHNYALSYALSQYSHAFAQNSRPEYEDDLLRMPLYTTPARATHRPTFVRLTQNAINSKTERTDDAPRGVNTPNIGWRGVLEPMLISVPSTLDRGGKPPAGYEFYAFARRDYEPPAVVRLGKKGCAIRVSWSEVSVENMQFVSDAIEASHAVNPLDVAGEIASYEPVMIPPHLLLGRAQIRNDWFIRSGRHTIHVQKRLRPEA